MSGVRTPVDAVAWRIVRADRTSSRWRDLPARRVTPSDGHGARIEFAFATPQAAVPALEVFRIAGGDVECEPRPTPDRALAVLLDLRQCYDELLTKTGGARA